MLLLLLFIFIELHIYLYIYPCIYIYFFSVQLFFFSIIKFLLWRYWWDVLLFASVPVAPVRGATTDWRRAPLVPELKASRAPGTVAAVVTLRVTIAWLPALFAFPSPLPVQGFLLLVPGVTAGARLIRLVDAQLTQRLT